MKIRHKSKVASKRSGIIKRNNANQGVKSVLLSNDVLSDPYVVAFSTQVVTSVVSYGYGKIKKHLRRHCSPLVTKCNFITAMPNKVCGADAEIVQIEIDGRQRIVHQCTEFTNHTVAIADKRRIKRLQQLGKYKK